VSRSPRGTPATSQQSTNRTVRQVRPDPVPVPTRVRVDDGCIQRHVNQFTVAADHARAGRTAIADPVPNALSTHGIGEYGAHRADATSAVAELWRAQLPAIRFPNRHVDADRADHNERYQLRREILSDHDYR